MDNNEQKDTVINTKKGKVIINNENLNKAIKSFYKKHKFSLKKEKLGIPKNHSKQNRTK